ncbi:DUF647-domain-containing protein [Gloeophyllum trabeum ATCC 11539]|uniref:DUF647-domain-containing protein n=1 Tax=Gloeophyllum trabeum (strain ATCC 11539 / FP-39264 / Madison 617) TaxID=670483 RepID=S7RHF3_GLOTA|nr:DUF647-domain-containing protein [Gloeophyllum trabeum ATCC 11539]EPQ53725.1 DUF647-domain-containing protein [Gloeophyllum trabeum ATCC 11539]
MLTIEEKDESGTVVDTYTVAAGRTLVGTRRDSEGTGRKVFSRARRVLEDVFLPAGYPTSVPPDYFRYQVYNALQAFFSALASLIASRAVLEGHGVGDPSASATDAMILTILQDVFSRLTTILGAYALGTSLFPEAKTYRFLADLLNDAAILLDSASPLLSLSHAGSPALPLAESGSTAAPVPRSGLRVAALCLSGALRALCGIAAGGSKAALTVHFARDGRAPGDVGDLNAKDGSRETVLSLLGMLTGTLVLRYLRDPAPTYAVLAFLVAAHLAANWAAVRAVVLPTLNRERAGLAWRAFSDGGGDLSAEAPAPAWVAARERVLAWRPAEIRGRDGRRAGDAAFASVADLRRHCRSHPGDALRAALERYKDERYLLLLRASPSGVLIFMKEGCTPMDRLKAWVNAVELVSRDPRAAFGSFDVFVRKMGEAGWRVEDGLVAAPARSVVVREGGEGEGKKGV